MSANGRGVGVKNRENLQTWMVPLVKSLGYHSNSSATSKTNVRTHDFVVLKGNYCSL